MPHRYSPTARALDDAASILRGLAAALTDQAKDVRQHGDPHSGISMANTVQKILGEEKPFENIVEVAQRELARIKAKEGATA
jgi:hypothetical protein